MVPFVPRLRPVFLFTYYDTFFVSDDAPTRFLALNDGGQ